MINEKHAQSSSIPGAPEIADHWLRKALLYDAKLIVVEDHSGTIIGSGNSFNGIVAGHSVLNNASPFTNNLSVEIHAVAHTSGGDRNATTREFFTGSQAGKKVIVLHVGSRGPVPKYAPNSTFTEHNGAQFVWLRATDLNAYRADGWLGQFLEVGFDDAKKLAKCNDREELPPELAKLEEDCPEFLDIILPGRIENRLAFRLLCEAAKVVAEENTKRKAKGEQTSITAALSGITIHAPKDLGEWLAPFGKSTPEEISQVAGMIGSGDVKKAAGHVLEAVNGHGDLADAITKFLNLTESQNS